MKKVGSYSCCIIASNTWWDWSLILWTYLPSVLWHCWLGHLTLKPVPAMTYNVFDGTLNLAQSIILLIATPTGFLFAATVRDRWWCFTNFFPYIFRFSLKTQMICGKYEQSHKHQTTFRKSACQDARDFSNDDVWHALYQGNGSICTCSVSKIWKCTTTEKWVDQHYFIPIGKSVVTSLPLTQCFRDLRLCCCSCCC